LRRFVITVAAYVAALVILVIPVAIGRVVQFLGVYQKPGPRPF